MSLSHGSLIQTPGFKQISSNLPRLIKFLQNIQYVANLYQLYQIFRFCLLYSYICNQIKYFIFVMFVMNVRSYKTSAAIFVTILLNTYKNLNVIRLSSVVFA